MEIRRLLTDSLTIARHHQPNKIAVVVGPKQYTYAELYQQSQIIADYLRQHGLQRGDRVAIFMENAWEILPCLYGALYASGIFVVVNGLTKAHKLEYLLRDSGAKFLFTDSALAKQFLPVIDTVENLLEVVYTGDTLEVISAVPMLRYSYIINTLPPRNDIQPLSINKDLAALIYTSGSTGDPKGVMMTHSNMVFTSDSLCEYLRLDTNAKILCFLPLAFDYGLYQILMAVRLGACLVICKSFMFPSLVFDDIEDQCVTVFPAVPTVFSMLVGLHQKATLIFPSVTRVTNTAAALPPEYGPILKQIFPNALIFKMYGLTECKRVCYLEPEKLEKFPSSVGKAIPGTEIVLLDANRKPVGPNTLGTLYVRGAHVMQGYWNKPQETQNMLIDGIYPNELVLCAQDQFVMDANGYLYFRGRVDDIIKSRGEKVSPVEVENALYSLPGIREAAVIGVPDPVEGEAIKAFVALNANVLLTEKQIKQHCMATLEAFMVPKSVEILDDLPKTDSNKISKMQLRNLEAV